MTKHKIERLDRTRITDDRLVDQYEINFEFEHGDGDATTHSSVTAPVGTTEAQLIEYLEAILDLASLVEDRRRGCVVDILRDPEPIHGIHIPMEYDVVYAAGQLYATMRCTNVWYFDDYGERWDIKIVVAK